MRPDLIWNVDLRNSGKESNSDRAFSGFGFVHEFLSSLFHILTGSKLEWLKYVESRMRLHQLSVGSKKRMARIVEQGIEHRLRGQHVNPGAPQRFKADGCVPSPSRAHAIAQNGDIDSAGEGFHGGLVNAHRRFNSAQEQMLDVLRSDGRFDAGISKR